MEYYNQAQQELFAFLSNDVIKMIIKGGVV